MTHHRFRSVTTSARGVFASGIVVGACLGLAAGHLLVFSGQQVDVETSAQADEFPLFDDPPGAFDLTAEADLPPDVAFSIVEVDDDPDVGRVTLSEIAPDPGEHLHFFPESMSEPGRDLARYDDVSLTSEFDPAPPVQLSAEVTAASDSAPQPLDPAPAAAPIDQQTSQREQRTRAIIRDELPEATTQEVDVWYEVLQGLPTGDIKGILRMRKNVGPGTSLPLGKILAAPVETSAPLASANERSDTAATRTDKQTLRQIDEHNRENRNTIAFKQLIPLVVEAPLKDGGGIRVRGIVRDMRAGKLQQTRRRLDVGIDGDAFLQVRRADDVRYTRDGRLSIDADGHLVLQATQQPWLLDPPVVVPTDATRISIGEDGVVTARVDDDPAVELGQIELVQFINPTALQAEADGLYTATPTSGSPHAVSAEQPGRALLRQGYLEASNVDFRQRSRHAKRREDGVRTR